MKAKKISMLLAVLVGAGMVLTGIASASIIPNPDENSIYLEIQASGKGYEADSDDPSAPAGGIVYTEDKHKLKAPIYVLCDRTDGYIHIAFYNEVSGNWSSQAIQIDVETEKSLFVKISGMIPIYVDLDGVAILTTGTCRVQFKMKDDTVKSAKMKSLAMSYWQSKAGDPEGNTQLLGAMKMKGKMVDPYDVMPAQVLSLFGLPL